MRAHGLIAALLVGVIAMGGCASPAEQAGDPKPAVSPSIDVRLEIVDEADNRDQDAHAMHVVTAMGYADSVVSHAFANGVVAMRVRGNMWTVDMRNWLCDTLIDEFRDSENVDQIVITRARSSSTAGTENSPPVRWNRPDMECTADPT